jgi:hypothetical protein
LLQRASQAEHPDNPIGGERGGEMFQSVAADKFQESEDWAVSGLE